MLLANDSLRRRRRVWGQLKQHLGAIEQYRLGNELFNFLLRSGLEFAIVRRGDGTNVLRSILFNWAFR